MRSLDNANYSFNGTDYFGTFCVTSRRLPLSNKGVLAGHSFVPQATFAVTNIVTPALSIQSIAPDSVKISWTPETAGYVLQESTNLLGTWNSAPGNYTNGATISVSQADFFRLIKP